MTTRVSDRQGGEPRGVPHYLARYVSSFEDFARRVETGSPAWLRALRAGALECFSEQGFPTGRMEAWRHTDVSAIAEAEFQLATSWRADAWSQKVRSLLPTDGDAITAVFANGHLVPELSFGLDSGAGEAGIRVESLAELASAGDPRLELRLARQPELKEHAFAALNTAFVDDGAVVIVPPDRAVAKPIHLLFLSTAENAQPTVCHPRVLIALGAGSQAVVIEDHVALGSVPTFSNAVTEVTSAAGAQLELVLLQRGSDHSFQISNLHSQQERDSRLRCHTVTLGGKLVRNDLTCVLADAGAECDLFGLFLGTASQLIDNHTLVDHAMPHASSRQLYKGILGDRSAGVFRGRVIVRPDAQQTSAEQYNPNLLLTQGAQVNSKPQLEIHADDVKCSHGSTVGRMDPEAVFFLRSRGIGEARARHMLTQGFADQITSALPVACLADTVRGSIVERISELTEGGAAT
jgi:Fe-S cluster assembly protein SufD